ncbi:MAG: polymorphic toxin type 46 domain-containing protein [Isosphaeraceae bacterium]
MPGGRNSGPLAHPTQSYDVHDGTNPRLETPQPGPLRGGVGEVASWPLDQKMIEAARRAANFLPLEMRDQFLELFAPEALAITAGVLVFWATSHAYGLGEIVDVILLILALAALGWQAVQVAKDLAAFVEEAADAESERDLDRAAMHLASVVATIGVTAFAALLFKSASKVGGRVSQVAAARARFWGRTVEEWLIVLTKPKAPPLVRQRLEVALDFLQQRLPHKPARSIEGYIKGIDLAKPVGRKTFQPGETVAMYGDPKNPGLYYTKPGTGMDRLGINPKGRQHIRYRFKQAVEALESRAASYADTWTDPGKTPLLRKDGSPMKLPNGQPAVADTKYHAGGGGLQYIIPDMQRLIDTGVVEIVKQP